MIRRSKVSILAILASLFLVGVASQSFADDPHYVFRYKMGAMGSATAGDTDGVCDVGEDPNSPDCIDNDDDGSDELVETVDPVPELPYVSVPDGTPPGFVPLALTPTTSNRDVNGSGVIYQCFKATGGYGNYSWTVYDIQAKYPGFDMWAEKVDVVTKADLGKPLVNSVFNTYPIAPATQMAGSSTVIKMDIGNEACLRIKVKADAIPADDVVLTLSLDDYSDDLVAGGVMDSNDFYTSDSYATVDVAMKPNCTSSCYPGDDGKPKVDTITIEKSSSNYGYQMSWEFTTPLTRTSDNVFYRCIKATGPNPYFTWSMAYQSPDITYTKWLKAWDIVPRSEFGTPVGASTHPDPDYDFPVSDYPVTGITTTSNEMCVRVKVDPQGLPAEGITTSFSVYNPELADGTNVSEDTYTPWRWEYVYINTTCKYGCTPPADDRLQDTGVTFERDPSGDEYVAEEGLDQFKVTPTTSQTHGDMFYQCFAITGGFGNYETQAWSWGDASWQNGLDVIPLASVNDAMDNNELDYNWIYPAIFSSPSTSTNNDVCVRVRPRQDGTGDRSTPFKVLVSVFDHRTVDGGDVSPPTQGDYQNFRFYMTFTPNAEDGDNNDDGICTFGETGSDCDGLCYPGEEGSSDCSIDPPPLNYGFGSIKEWGYVSTGHNYGHDLEDPLLTSDIIPVWFLRDTFSSRYAVTYGGAGFSYQCFNASGPEAGYDWWRYSMEVNPYSQPIDWLTNLDIVPRSGLYGGIIKPMDVMESVRYPENWQLVTTETNMCIRWIARKPTSGERNPLDIRVFANNYNDASEAAKDDPQWISGIFAGLLTID